MPQRPRPGRLRPLVVPEQPPEPPVCPPPDGTVAGPAQRLDPGEGFGLPVRVVGVADPLAGRGQGVAAVRAAPADAGVEPLAQLPEVIDRDADREFPQALGAPLRRILESGPPLPASLRH